ncbi:MAG: hypothetical protein ACI83D_000671 [Planctomycetota bacterium]|jgi:hypothetical protein
MKKLLFLVGILFSTLAGQMFAQNPWNIFAGVQYVLTASDGRGAISIDNNDHLSNQVALYNAGVTTGILASGGNPADVMFDLHTEFGSFSLLHRFQIQIGLEQNELKRMYLQIGSGSYENDAAVPLQVLVGVDIAFKHINPCAYSTPELFNVFVRGSLKTGFDASLKTSFLALGIDDAVDVYLLEMAEQNPGAWTVEQFVTQRKALITGLAYGAPKNFTGTSFVVIPGIHLDARIDLRGLDTMSLPFRFEMGIAAEYDLVSLLRSTKRGGLQINGHVGIVYTY